MSPLVGSAGFQARRANVTSEKTVLVAVEEGVGECRTGMEELEGVYSVRTGKTTKHFRRKSKTD